MTKLHARIFFNKKILIFYHENNGTCTNALPPLAFLRSDITSIKTQLSNDERLAYIYIFTNFNEKRNLNTSDFQTENNRYFDNIYIVLIFNMEMLSLTYFP